MSKQSVRRFQLTSYEVELIKPTMLGEYLTMSTMFLEDVANIGDLGKVHKLARETLELLQKRHPFLRAHLEINDENTFLVLDNKCEHGEIQFESVDLTDQQQTPSRDSLINTCAQFNVRLFDIAKEFLWRVQLISYQDQGHIKYILNLVLNMAITDGLSITNLSAEFLNIFNSLYTGQSCREMKETLEPCESIHYYFEKGHLFNEEHAKQAKEFKAKKSLFKLHKYFESNETGFHLELFKFDPETSSMLVKTCKSLNVRVTAFFYTAMMYSMKRLYVENGLQFASCFPVEFAMNLRMRFKPNIPLEACRFMVTFGEDEIILCESEDFATDCQNMQTLVDKCSSVQTGAVFADIYNTLNSSLEPEHNYTDICLSNLGTFVSDSKDIVDGPLKIKEIYCSDSMHLYPHLGLALQVHVIFWKGEINVQFGANKRYFTIGYSKRFVELLREVIYQNIKSL